MEEAIAALRGVLGLDRKKVRQRFEQRFSATRMAKDYVGIYRSLLSSKPGTAERSTKRRSRNGNEAITQSPIAKPGFRDDAGRGDLGKAFLHSQSNR